MGNNTTQKRLPTRPIRHTPKDHSVDTEWKEIQKSQETLRRGSSGELSTPRPPLEELDKGWVQV